MDCMAIPAVPYAAVRHGGAFDCMAASPHGVCPSRRISPHLAARFRRHMKQARWATRMRVCMVTSARILSNPSLHIERHRKSERPRVSPRHPRGDEAWDCTRGYEP